jgi:hypothetical protein
MHWSTFDDGITPNSVCSNENENEINKQKTNLHNHSHILSSFIKKQTQIR